MSDHFQNLSRRLYDILERVGASEDMRRLHQSVGIKMEITDTIKNHLQPPCFSTFVLGSNCEGATTPGLNSDMDILTSLDDLPVISNIDAAGDGLSLLMVYENTTPPGYVKLQSVYNAIPQTVYTTGIIDNLDSDSDGRICFKHMSKYGQSDIITERNGPADTMTQVGPADFVFALKCATVPDGASDWITRQPSYDWPSVQMIDQMKSSGCLVVGTGHPDSVEKEIEWRLSFSLQERQLMFSLNPVQHKCYILLKMIKTDIIQPALNKSISSYHCKTCIFYVIENTRPSIWRPENLFSCMRLCLIVLRNFVVNRNCPNYFVKEANMFDRDVHRNVRPCLTELLTELISVGPAILLQITSDQIGEIMMGYENFNRASENIMISRKNLKVTTLSTQCNCFDKINRLLRDNDKKSNTRWLSKLICELASCVYFGHDEGQTTDAVNHIIPFLHLRLAEQLASMACSDCVNGTFLLPHLLHESHKHFRKGSLCDVASSRLMHASVLYKFGEYDRCEDLLEQVNMDLQPDVETVCFCSTGKFRETTNNIPDENMPSSVSSTATCVMFRQSDITVTPPPLQYEMYRSLYTLPGSRDKEKDYWYDCAVVDGKVYPHCLKYFVYSKLNNIENKQLAISNLRSVLENEPNLAHRETGYNLLGWIYIQENCIPEGFSCFIKSWQIKPHHNSAKWHLGCVVNTQLGHMF